MIFGLFGKKTPPPEQEETTLFEATRAAPAPVASRIVGDADLLRKQRACLFEVIRECMIASGVLSSGYTFKVLSVDQTHQQFQVLFDLGPEFNTDTHRLSEMEQMICVSAMRRYQVKVNACFWRIDQPVQAAVQESLQDESESSPEDDQELRRAQARAQLAELFATSPNLPESRMPEFAATEFAPNASVQQGQPKSYALLTGYEETEATSSVFKPTEISRPK
jgi:hypothetical protein